MVHHTRLCDRSSECKAPLAIGHWVGHFITRNGMPDRLSKFAEHVYCIKIHFEDHQATAAQVYGRARRI